MYFIKCKRNYHDRLDWTIKSAVFYYQHEHNWPKDTLCNWWVDRVIDLRHEIIHICKSGRFLKFRWRRLEIWNCYSDGFGNKRQALNVANGMTGEGKSFILRDYMDDDAEIDYVKLTKDVAALDDTPMPEEQRRLWAWQMAHTNRTIENVSAMYYEAYLIRERNFARNKALRLANKPKQTRKRTKSGKTAQ